MNDKSEIGYKSSLPGPLGTLDTWISRLEAAMLSIGVLLLAVNTVGNVLSRFLLGESIYFSEEINRVLIVVITFAGIGYATRHGRHIRMSALYDALPLGARRALMVLICLVTASLMILLCYYAVQYINTIQGRGRVLPALGMPVWWMYVWVPVGFAITAIQYLLTAYKNLISPEVYLSTHVEDGYEEDGL